jgi:hypothetical protein
MIEFPRVAMRDEPEQARSFSRPSEWRQHEDTRKTENSLRLSPE